MKKPQKLRIEVIHNRRAEVVLKEAIDKGNWFEAVVLSSVYLESYAIDRLRKYLASKRVRGRPFLHRMNLARAARILEELRLIDQKTHSMIGDINAYRNKVVHEFRNPEVIKPDKAKQIVDQTLKCFEAIVSSYKTVEKQGK